MNRSRSPLARAAALAFPLLAAALSAPGCQSAEPAVEAPARAAYTYRVGAGDLLRVEVFQERDLRFDDLAVAPDGRLEFPLVGSLHVQDLTLLEVAELVAAELRRRQALTDPRVTVTLKESRSAQVLVLGEVLRQRAVPFRDRIGIAETLCAVGGVNWTTAKTEDVRIVRGALDHPEAIPVDLDDLLAGERADVFLRPGDIVVVPAKWVTRWDRYFSQLLGPLRVAAGGGTSAAGAAGSVP